MHLLQKYVDDFMTALEEMKRGTRLGSYLKVIISMSEAAERLRGRITMKAVTCNVSSILTCLQFTWDSPKQNKTGMMPLLDTMIWVGQSARSLGVLEVMLQDNQPTNYNRCTEQNYTVHNL